VLSSVAVPSFLAAVAILDGALAGFRASAGRCALIRKVRYNAIAAARGAACTCLLLLGLAAGLGSYLAATRHQSTAFAELVAAGSRMSLVYLPFVAVVLVSLAGYLTLPLRASSWLILAGLGPLTLVRPVVAVTGGIAALWHSTGLAVPIVTAAAVAGVLAIEPAVHHRWYRAVYRTDGASARAGVSSPR
jgi:hypothetical protein